MFQLVKNDYKGTYAYVDTGLYYDFTIYRPNYTCEPLLNLSSKIEELDDKDLTQFAMLVSEDSLHEDWDSEEDKIWDK
jgi:hypothetical protein